MSNLKCVIKVMGHKMLPEVRGSTNGKVDPLTIDLYFDIATPPPSWVTVYANSLDVPTVLCMRSAKAPKGPALTVTVAPDEYLVMRRLGYASTVINGVGDEHAVELSKTRIANVPGPKRFELVRNAWR